ncbi:MAG: oligosaccharide flippase family protein [Bacteroidota bacterium]
MTIPGLNNKHFLVLVGNALGISIGFSISFLLFHFLPVHEVGIWFFIMSIVALCEAARYGFLATATVSFYAGTTPERGATVMGSVWFLALSLSGIIAALNGLAFFILPHTHNVELILCIKWVGITYLSTVCLDVVSWKLQAEEKYSTIVMYRMTNSILTILSFTILIYTGRMTLENALLLNVVTNLIVSGLVLVRGSGIRYITRRSAESVRELTNYGKYMLGTTTVSSLLVNADTWIINYVLGPAAVAVYNLAIRFMAVIELPIRTLLTTGTSEMAIAYNRDDLPQVTHIFKKYAGMLTIIFIPIVLGGIVLADIPIYLLGGAKYSGTIAANSFRLFLLASLLYPIDRFNGLVLDMIRQTKVNFYKVIIMLGTKVTFNFVGLALFGNIYGVNLSCFIMTIVAIVYGNYQLRRCIRYKFTDILRLGYKEVKLLVNKKVKDYRLVVNPASKN